MYGFEIEKVRTLNMQGKRKQRGGRLISRPNYKKAYVTLRAPISIAPLLYNARETGEDRHRANKQPASHYSREVDDRKGGGTFEPEKQFSERGNSDLYAIGTLGSLDS